MMSRKTSIALCVLALVLVAATGMAAQKGNKTTMTVADPVTVGATTLAAGDYQVTWEGNDGQVQVTFLKNKKVVASAPARIAPRSNAPDETVVVTEHKGGAVTLVEIRPEGRKEALLLDVPANQQ